VSPSPSKERGRVGKRGFAPLRHPIHLSPLLRRGGRDRKRG